MQEEQFDFENWMKDVSEKKEANDKSDPIVEDEKSYEEKVARLEEIVSLLERGEVSL